MKLRADDKRQSLRIAFKVPVEIYRQDDTFIMLEAEMINLSVHGMLIRVNNIEAMSTEFSKDLFARIIIPGHGSRLIIEGIQ